VAQLVIIFQGLQNPKLVSFFTTAHYLISSRALSNKKILL